MPKTSLILDTSKV